MLSVPCDASRTYRWSRCNSALANSRACRPQRTLLCLLLVSPGRTEVALGLMQGRMAGIRSRRSDASAHSAGKPIHGGVGPLKRHRRDVGAVESATPSWQYHPRVDTLAIFNPAVCASC
jgi:hypothetical protein